MSDHPFKDTVFLNEHSRAVYDKVIAEALMKVSKTSANEDLLIINAEDLKKKGYCVPFVHIIRFAGEAELLALSAMISADHKFRDALIIDAINIAFGNQLPFKIGGPTHCTLKAWLKRSEDLLSYITNRTPEVHDRFIKLAFKASALEHIDDAPTGGWEMWLETHLSNMHESTVLSNIDEFESAFLFGLLKMVSRSFAQRELCSLAAVGHIRMQMNKDPTYKKFIVDFIAQEEQTSLLLRAFSLHAIIGVLRKEDDLNLLFDDFCDSRTVMAPFFPTAEQTIEAKLRCEFDKVRLTEALALICLELDPDFSKGLESSSMKEILTWIDTEPTHLDIKRNNMWQEPVACYVLDRFIDLKLRDGSNDYVSLSNKIASICDAVKLDAIKPASCGGYQIEGHRLPRLLSYALEERQSNQHDDGPLRPQQFRKAFENAGKLDLIVGKERAYSEMQKSTVALRLVKLAAKIINNDPAGMAKLLGRTGDGCKCSAEDGCVCSFNSSLQKLLGSRAWLPDVFLSLLDDQAFIEILRVVRSGPRIPFGVTLKMMKELSNVARLKDLESNLLRPAFFWSDADEREHSLFREALDKFQEAESAFEMFVAAEAGHERLKLRAFLPYLLFDHGLGAKNDRESCEHYLSNKIRNMLGLNEKELAVLRLLAGDLDVLGSVFSEKSLLQRVPLSSHASLNDSQEKLRVLRPAAYYLVCDPFGKQSSIFLALISSSLGTTSSESYLYGQIFKVQETGKFAIPFTKELPISALGTVIKNIPLKSDKYQAIASSWSLAMNFACYTLAVSIPDVCTPAQLRKVLVPEISRDDFFCSDGRQEPKFLRTDDEWSWLGSYCYSGMETLLSDMAKTASESFGTLDYLNVADDHQTRLCVQMLNFARVEATQAESNGRQSHGWHASFDPRTMAKHAVAAYEKEIEQVATSLLDDRVDGYRSKLERLIVGNSHAHKERLDAQQRNPFSRQPAVIKRQSKKDSLTAKDLVSRLCERLEAMNFSPQVNTMLEVYTKLHLDDELMSSKSKQHGLLVDALSEEDLACLKVSYDSVREHLVSRKEWIIPTLESLSVQQALGFYTSDRLLNDDRNPTGGWLLDMITKIATDSQIGFGPDDVDHECVAKAFGWDTMTSISKIFTLDVFHVTARVALGTGALGTHFHNWPLWVELHAPKAGSDDEEEQWIYVAQALYEHSHVAWFCPVDWRDLQQFVREQASSKRRSSIDDSDRNLMASAKVDSDAPIQSTAWHKPKLQATLSDEDIASIRRVLLRRLEPSKLISPLTNLMDQHPLWSASPLTLHSVLPQWPKEDDVPLNALGAVYSICRDMLNDGIAIFNRLDIVLTTEKVDFQQQRKLLIQVDKGYEEMRLKTLGMLADLLESDVVTRQLRNNLKASVRKIVWATNKSGVEFSEDAAVDDKLPYTLIHGSVTSAQLESLLHTILECSKYLRSISLKKRFPPFEIKLGSFDELVFPDSFANGQHPKLGDDNDERELLQPSSEISVDQDVVDMDDSSVSTTSLDESGENIGPADVLDAMARAVVSVDADPLLYHVGEDDMELNVSAASVAEKLLSLSMVHDRSGGQISNERSEPTKASGGQEAFSHTSPSGGKDVTKEPTPKKDTGASAVVASDVGSPTKSLSASRGESEQEDPPPEVARFVRRARQVFEGAGLDPSVVKKYCDQIVEDCFDQFSIKYMKFIRPGHWPRIERAMTKEELALCKGESHEDEEESSTAAVSFRMECFGRRLTRPVHMKAPPRRYIDD